MPQNVYIYHPNIPVPKNVRFVEIPEWVTEIKRGAFDGCSDLLSVTMPDGLTKIGMYAFSGCRSLQEVILPPGVREIGNFAFHRCAGLQSVTMPESLTKIGMSAFSQCKSLRSVTLPSGVREIGNLAFFHCESLQSVALPHGITEIGVSAFADCKGLQSVAIPDSVTTIGWKAFANCTGLRSFKVPDGVTEIRADAFRDCTGLQSVELPDSLTNIEPGAFRNCTALRSVVLPDSIKTVPEYAFYQCCNLESVTIPNGVTKLQANSFDGCVQLRSVTLPDSITEIGDSAFNGCSGMLSVSIPGGLTKISIGAFRNCTGLRSVVIPDGVKEIEGFAFKGCTGLQSVTIPAGVTTLGPGAFRNCTALSHIMIPNGIKTIQANLLQGCAVQSVTIPDSVTKIGSSAFSRCRMLRSITIPDSVTEMGSGVFAECDNLRSVTLSKNITEIKNGVFGECTALQAIDIPDNVTMIEECAFYDCQNLRSVTLPDNIRVIKEEAFVDCPRLDSMMFRGVNIAPFINIGGYGVNTFDVIKTLLEHQIPLSENAVRTCIDMAHQGKLPRWILDYPKFGEMRLASFMKSVHVETEKKLRRCFLAQKRTKGRVPGILDILAITARACEIPPERLAAGFDVRYTEALIRDGIPLVPAEACRCYYDRNVCDMLNKKGKIFVMAEAIALYNMSGHRECYKHLMDFIRLHPDTRTEDLLYATDHAQEIPVGPETTIAQVRQHQTRMKNLAEVEKIEAEYEKTVLGFKLSDYPCNLERTGIVYGGLTARILDLSDSQDIALAARLGELTNCCQCLESAGETAMMHGFLNPDAGFWVIEDKDGNIKAQAEIWEADKGVLVFDNIEFADTDRRHRAERINRLRGVIAAWAMESGYKNIIMGCGYNELGTESMEPAPIPELRLTPEEVYALQEDNNAGVYFADIGKTREYMQTGNYNPNDFVYTDANGQCVYIKKDGIVSDYLIKGYDRAVAEQCCPTGRKTSGDRSSGSLLM